MFQKAPYSFLTLFFCTLLLIFSCIPEIGETKSSPTPTVLTRIAKEKPIFDLKSYPARVYPKMSANVLADAEGIIRSVKAVIGKTVKKGELLFSIENPDPVYQYALLQVRSPIEGIVSSLETSEGSRTNKGQRLAIVIDPRDLQIRIEVPSQDLNLLKAKQKGDFTATNQEKTWPVQIEGISPYADPATGTASVELRFVSEKSKKKKKEEQDFFPGMLGKVLFEVNHHPGMEVPDSAIVYRDQKTWIRTILEGEKAKYQEVKLGPIRNSLVEIQSGLVTGTKYIVRSSMYIANGEKVSPEKDPQENPPEEKKEMP